MQEYDIIVIGGGSAGLLSAIAAKENGIDNILILERESQLGGVLNQSIHTGFGSNIFNDDLTGTEYAQRLVDKINELNIEFKLNTAVINLTKDKVITIVNEEGVIELKARSVILAMGCREKPRGAMNIHGSKCAGIFTAGTAQNFINIDGYMPGKQIVILGSGYTGLILARRITLEGGNIRAVVELSPYVNSPKKNVKECLEDFKIPLKLGYTAVDIKGKDRVEGITIAKADTNNMIIKGTEEYIPCDTILVAVGMLPENELLANAEVEFSDITCGAIVDESMQTNIEGIFACGNIVYVHDFEEDSTMESYIAGKNAADFCLGKNFDGKRIEIEAKDGISYTVPAFINTDYVDNFIDIRFRADNNYKNARAALYFNYEKMLEIKKDEFTPIETQYIRLTLDMLKNYEGCSKISLKIEKNS